jgi:hypothetical protein
MKLEALVDHYYKKRQHEYRATLTDKSLDYQASISGNKTQITVWNINIKKLPSQSTQTEKPLLWIKIKANQCRPMKTLPAARLPNRTRPGQLAAVVRLHIGHDR